MRNPAPGKIPTLLALAIVVLLALLPAGASPARAQALSDFMMIHSANPGQYDHYQLKFTFLGSQKKTILSLGMAGQARAFDPAAFVPWQVDYQYSNDDPMGEVLTVPGVDWQFFMDAISLDPVLQSTVRIPDPNCSLMIQTDQPVPMCWEHLADGIETDLLFQLLADSVADPAQKEIIHRFRRQMAGVRL